MQEDRLSTTQPVSRRARGGESQAPSRVAYVQVLTGKLAGYVVRLDEFGMVLGRGDDCQLVLDEAGISRRHAQIVAGPGGEYWLEDLGSTNGTFVEDQEIQRHLLRDGDRVELGETSTLKFGVNSPEELELAEKLYDCATRDSLTRALNRGSLFERLHQEIAYCTRHARPLSVLMLDVDFFKKINDGYGHPCGDYVLRFLAELLRRHIRLEDVLGRYGGEEFCLLLRQTAPRAAQETAERLRGYVEESRPSYVTQDDSTLAVCPRLTVSIGVTSLQPGDSVDQLLARADAALYRAKRGGRNRVEAG